jgi:hypothetical protein
MFYSRINKIKIFNNREGFLVLFNRGAEMRIYSYASNPGGLNEALPQNGLLKANEMAYWFYIGKRYRYRKAVINTGIEGLISSNGKDGRKSILTSWGPSLEVGYKILETGKMELYPYTGISWPFVFVAMILISAVRPSNKTQSRQDNLSGQRIPKDFLPP